MLGSIIGDIVGSPYEFNNIKTKEFPLFKDSSIFTDDTILTIATAECLMNHSEDYGKYYRLYGNKYPSSYGAMFLNWLKDKKMGPYNSCGNGSAMRVGPIGILSEDLEVAIIEAKRSAEVTHNHPSGVKGAQAVASAVWLAKHGYNKKFIKEFITSVFHYKLNSKLKDIRPKYKFGEMCHNTVPEAIIAFLESNNFEDAIRNAVSLGGDSDTLACITGSIAEAFYRNIPDHMIDGAIKRIPQEFQEIIHKFYWETDNYNIFSRK